MLEAQRPLPYAAARIAARRWVDSYQPRGKLHPAVCTQCRAAEWQGQWRWNVELPDLAPVLCPACERTRDGAAAHTIELTGAMPPHWNTVRTLLGQVERDTIRDAPMERLMPFQVLDDRVVVRTTGKQIARRAVAALVRRWRHGLRLTFGADTTTIEWLDSGR